MIAHHGERFLRFRIFQKPLLAQARLDRHTAALAETDRVFIRLFLRQQIRFPASISAAFLRASKRSSPSSSGTFGQLIVPFGCRTSIDRQLVALPDFEIEFVVAGVTLSTPVPNSGSIASSPTIGICSRDRADARRVSQSRSR